MKAFFCHGHHKVCTFCDEPHALKIVRENYLLILMLLRVSTWHIVAAAKHKQDLHTFSLFPCPDMAVQATQFRGNNPSMAAMMPAKHHSRALQFPRRSGGREWNRNNKIVSAWEMPPRSHGRRYSQKHFSLCPACHLRPLDKFWELGKLSPLFGHHKQSPFSPRIT